MEKVLRLGEVGEGRKGSKGHEKILFISCYNN
jgi:hypothetical protein